MGDGLFLLVPVLAAAEEIALGRAKVLDGLRLAPVYVRAGADPHLTRRDKLRPPEGPSSPRRGHYDHA